MNAAVQNAPATLFRDSADARAHSMVLSYVLLGWLGSFLLMGSRSIALDVPGRPAVRAYHGVGGLSDS